MQNDTGGIQVLRFEPRQTLDNALVQHNLGTGSRPSYATGRPPLRWKTAQADLTAAKKRLKELTAVKRRGRRANHIIDCIIGGPPPFGSEHEWSDERIKAWAADSREWIKQTFPHSTIAVAAVHRDETSPHLHVMFVPEASGAKLSWAQCQKEACADEKKEKFYRTLQNRYQREVGEKHGLGRGEIGSDRKHEPINVDKVVDERVRQKGQQLEAEYAKKEKFLNDREVLLKQREKEAREQILEAGKSLKKSLELDENDKAWWRKWRKDFLKRVTMAWRSLSYSSVSSVSASTRSVPAAPKKRESAKPAKIAESREKTRRESHSDGVSPTAMSDSSRGNPVAQIGSDERYRDELVEYLCDCIANTGDRKRTLDLALDWAAHYPGFPAVQITRGRDGQANYIGLKIGELRPKRFRWAEIAKGVDLTERGGIER